ncbi:uncharacterized protein LOC141719320 [Apium graveolens]|uniref:uncharacterized protein LOC141719320 n=1 Tax=Apium graveolens TaxID=4045 RepID=UPI003D797A23
MEPFLPTNKDYQPLGALCLQNSSFHRSLSSIVRHERTLKIRLKRQMAANSPGGSIHTAFLKKMIAKQARMRRKIVILSRKLQTNQGLPYFSAMQIMHMCSQHPSQLLLLRHCIKLVPSNGLKLLCQCTKHQSSEQHHELSKLSQISGLSLLCQCTRHQPSEQHQELSKLSQLILLLPEQRAKLPRVPSLTGTTNNTMRGPLLTTDAGPSNTSTNWAAAEQPFSSYFGPPGHNYMHCGAAPWYEERVKRNRHTSDPHFTICCEEGPVKLQLLKEPPALLKHLLGPNSGQHGTNFKQNIRPYNLMFAVTSLGVQVDRLINKSRGPYVFHASGQIYHNTSSLLPPAGKKPLFAQLYIYDTDHEVSNRISTLLNPERGPAIDESIVQGLKQILDEHSNLVRSYRKARDMFEEQPQTTFHLWLPEARTRDGRQYNIPTKSEVGGLIVGELSEKKFERDVIVCHRTKGITHIDELHPSYMSMEYPLIHPYGEDGYRLGRLLQQYIVDAYMAVEQERFRWVRTHQSELRTELYSGLMNAVHHGDLTSSTVGKSVILPSSHTGGPRYRAQNYQDAMAICRYISACEACWRIFQFGINYRYPAVERLPFHLPNEHTVIFEESRCIENVLNMPGIEKTKFTELLETNRKHEDARSLTYAKFPQHWVWNSKCKLWTKQKKGNAVGRIYFAHPSSGERFYMRMLLNFIKGSTSFECIRTINGVTYPTFNAACYALGLLDDDREWIDCLSEAAVWATGNELRNLFVTMLVFCQVSNVPELWKSHSTILSEDMLYLQRKRFQVPNLHLTQEQIESYALVEIEGIMQKLGKSLKDIDGMPQPDSSLTLASLLLPNGRTTHSRFRIPLDITAESTCEIKHDIIDASLNPSYLRPHFEIFELKQNMRLHREVIEEIEAEKIASFDRWLLQIGDDSLYENPAQELIRIPPELCSPTIENPMEGIVGEVYLSLLENYMDIAYIKERAILTPKNETVHELNDFLMNMIPGEGRTYLSSDSVCKEGTPIMLLRNLNQFAGLCNGTRLIVSRLGKWSIRGYIISGAKVGQNVTISRIIMSSKESKWPFKLNRRQLPVAPCFAMTINKSQGQSLNRVGMYLPSQVFTHGQVYVALSRVTGIEGLIIVNADTEVKDQALIKNIVYK